MASAMPANGIVSPFVQPNGSPIELRNAGDEWLHWHETADGFLAAQDTDGFWKYARAEADTHGRIRFKAVRGAIVGRSSPGALGLKRRDLPSRAAIRKHTNTMREFDFLDSSATHTFPADLARKMKASPPRPPGSLSASSVVTLGKRNVRCLVILAAFADHWDETNKTVLKEFGYPPDAYHRLFNESGYNERGAIGSVRDFYLENSYGNLTIESTILGWVKVPETEAWYGDNENEILRMRQMVSEAINAVDQAGFNFEDGDQDQDFYVDLVHVIHSGYTETQNGNPSHYVWDRAGTIVGRLAIDDVGITTYSYSAALRGTKNTAPPITGIGPICHELGHQLGLPDLYDPSNFTHGVGTWCTMGTGSWGGSINFDGRQPVHLSARCKQLLGFVTPKIMHSQNGIEIRNVENHPDIHLIRDGSPNENEYFLVENRQPVGFDSQLPGGILIWHVRHDLFFNNSFSLPHPSVRLEEARGRNLLQHQPSAAANQTWSDTNGLPGGFRDLTGDPDSNAMVYQEDSDYFRFNDPASYTRIRMNNFSANGPTMTYDLQTVVPTVAPSSDSGGNLSLQWSAASDALLYTIQEGRLDVDTTFSDGAENPESLFDQWITTGTIRRSAEDAHSGTYSFSFAMQDELSFNTMSHVQSMELRQPFTFTPSTRLVFWMKSQIEVGSGYLFAQITTDNGERWRTLTRISGRIASWDEIILEPEHFLASGTSPGNRCRLRFLIHIPNIWGWSDYPRYGFAIDDIRLTGIQIQTQDWKTLGENFTGTALAIGPKPPGRYLYRVRALVDGQWQKFSLPGEGTVHIPDYQTWAMSLPPADRGVLADPDGDSVPNFAEHALGRDPQSTDGHNAIQIPIGEVSKQGGENRFALKFDLPEFPPPDVSYSIEAASKLDGPWTAVAGYHPTLGWTTSMVIIWSQPNNQRIQVQLLDLSSTRTTRKFYRFTIGHH